MLYQEAKSIAIADDNIFYRVGLQATIEEFNSYKVDVVADSGQSLMYILSERDKPADICIMDISMPDSYDTMKAIKKRWPQTKVLVLTLYNVELNLVKSVKIGANGFLLKHSNTNEIRKALDVISTTGMYYSDILPEESMRVPQESILLNLSYREMEYISLCCSDMPQKAIAEKMSIKLTSVNSLRDGLYKKLNVKNRIGIVLFALRIGMMPSETIC